MFLKTATCEYMHTFNIVFKTSHFVCHLQVRKENEMAKVENETKMSRPGKKRKNEKRRRRKRNQIMVTAILRWIQRWHLPANWIQTGIQKVAMWTWLAVTIVTVGSRQLILIPQTLLAREIFCRNALIMLMSVIQFPSPPSLLSPIQNTVSERTRVSANHPHYWKTREKAKLKTAYANLSARKGLVPHL